MIVAENGKAEYVKLRKKLIEVKGGRIRRWWNRRKLSKPCKIVADYEKCEKLMAFMESAASTFHRYHPAGCYGLAANQFGIRKRVFAIRKPNRNAFTVYVNPMIVKGARQQTKTEYCLSHPGDEFKVERFKTITVDSDNIGLQTLSGIEAQAFQHEMDHLNGKLV